MGIFSNKISKTELNAGDHIYSWRRAYAYAHHDPTARYDLVEKGIYVGNDKVVHFTRGEGQEQGTRTFLDTLISSSIESGPCMRCPDCGFKRENSGVILSCLDCFLAGGTLYRFEYGVSPAIFFVQARGGTCTLAESDPPELVIHRVMYLLHKGFGNYHIFSNNCEDFAKYCKTELLPLDKSSLGTSGQAASFIGVPVAAMLSSPFRFMMAGPVGTMTVTAGAYFLSRYATDIGIRTDKVKVSVEDLHRNLGWLTNEEQASSDNSPDKLATAATASLNS